MQQASFADRAYTHQKKLTRKERFLTEMEQLRPWPQLLQPIRQRYPNPGPGRRPIRAEGLLRLSFLQQW